MNGNKCIENRCCEQKDADLSFHGQLNDFLDVQIIGRGLNPRTAEAYRMDMEHFYQWLKEPQKQGLLSGDIRWEEEMEAYLEYLLRNCP